MKNLKKLELKKLREISRINWQQNEKMKLEIKHENAEALKWLAISTPFVLTALCLIFIAR